MHCPDEEARNDASKETITHSSLLSFPFSVRPPVACEGCSQLFHLLPLLFCPCVWDKLPGLAPLVVVQGEQRWVAIAVAS
jgi:hypothetical protein